MENNYNFTNKKADAFTNIEQKLPLKERLIRSLKDIGMEEYITHSFEEAHDNDRRKNIVLLDDGIYITFKAKTEEEDKIFGELVCWVEDEFAEDESLYDTVENAVSELFSYTDEELNQHIHDNDIIENFTRYEEKQEKEIERDNV